MKAVEALRADERELLEQLERVRRALGALDGQKGPVPLTVTAVLKKRHPFERMKIVHALGGGMHLTAKQIAKATGKKLNSVNLILSRFPVFKRDGAGRWYHEA